jgi:hypothetical protein
MTDDDMLYFLYDADLWNHDMQEELDEKLPNDMETFKKELFKCWGREQEVKEYRYMLKAANDNYSRLFNIRHKYDYLTDVGLANYSKIAFIVEKSTSGSNSDLGKLISHYYEHSLGDEFLRVLCNKDPWTSIWKEGMTSVDVFGNPTAKATEEQRRIIMWSCFYDNMLKSENKPNPEIINDQDAVDGWFYIEVDNQKKIKAQKQFEKRLGKNRNAQEVFIFAEEGKEVNPKEIYELNSPLSRAIIKSRESLIKEHGVVDHSEFKDIKKMFQLVSK